MLVILLQDALWSGLAALGFAVLFNVPRRTLLGCVLAGAVGHVVRTLLNKQLGVHISFATLGGATVIGFMGMLFARYWKTPMNVFTISGAIPMVPGVFAYRTMLGLLSIATNPPINDVLVLTETAQNAINTGLVIGGIAIGILLPKLLFRREKPIV